MPQGSRLGPLSFIVLIDDLKAACEMSRRFSFLWETGASDMTFEFCFPDASNVDF